MALLQQCRSGTETVLLNRNGTPLVHERISPAGKYCKSDNVKNAYERVLKKLSLARPFKLLRKTSATLIHSHERFRGLDQLFLGHAPAPIPEKHYSATGRNALDAALEYMREEYPISPIIDSISAQNEAGRP